MKTPKHLQQCACGSTSFVYEGEQLYPAKYAAGKHFAEKLTSGIYHWNKSYDSFGISLFTCTVCGSTLTDESKGN